MSVVRTRDWDAAVRRVEKAMGKRSFLTVDVFDTLLMRASSPELVTRIVCERISRVHGVPASSVAKAREAAVRVMESTRTARGQEAEVEFGAFAAEIARRCEIDADPADLLDVEETSEIPFLVPNVAVADMVRRLRAKGRTVVAMSDMYLPSACVRRLLEAKGMGDLVDDVWVSGEKGASKREGGLFELFKAGYGVASGDWVHVGDHASADGLKASEAGAVAVVCLSPVLLRHRLESRRLEASSAHDPHAAARLARHVARYEDLVAPRSDPYAVGRDSLGLVIGAFSMLLGREARRDGVDRLWFLAREGFLLKWAYDVVHGFDQAGAPPSAYLLASRASLFPAANPVFGLRGLSAAILNCDVPTPWNLVKATGIGRGEAEAIASGNGLRDLDEPVDAIGDPRMHALLGDPRFAAAVETAHRRALDAFRSYADASGFGGEGNVGVVDVGWSGQIQSYLADASRAVGGPSRILGYYVATKDAAEIRSSLGMPASGLISTTRDRSWASRSAFLSVTVFEDSCRAPHGSVVGYGDGEAVLKDETAASRIEEAAGDPQIAVVQAGILRFASVIGALRLVSHPATADALRESARRELARLLRVPTRREAEVFLSVPHVLNFSDDKVVIQGVADGTGWTTPIRSFLAVRRSRWKEGVATKAFGSAGAVLVAARRALKEAKETPPALPARPPAPACGGRAGNAAEVPACPVEARARRASVELAASARLLLRRPERVAAWPLAAVDVLYARATGAPRIFAGNRGEASFRTRLAQAAASMRHDPATHWIRRPLRRLIDAAGI